MTINKFCWFFSFSIKLFSVFTIIYLAFSFPIKAHHKIDNPTIKFSESPEIRNFFFEWRGHINLDRKKENHETYHQVLEFVKGWNKRYETDFELHIADLKNSSLAIPKVKFQNKYNFINNKNFLFSTFFSFNLATEKNSSDQIEYKFLFQNKFKYFVFNNGFGFYKNINGKNSKNTVLKYFPLIYFKKPIISDIHLAIAGSSDFGKISKFSTYTNQKHQYGVGIKKTFQKNTPHEVDITIAYLKGLNSNSFDQSLIWYVNKSF